MSASAVLQQLPLFGRKYQLLIKFPPNDQGQQTVMTVTDSAFEPEALRITFDVYTVVRSLYWWADITIYNLDEATATQILGYQNSNIPSGTQQGMEVVLYAGYLSGSYGVIWDGYVMQPLWDRENVVDYKLTLHCILGLTEETRNFVANTYNKINQIDLITRMAKDSFRPIPLQTGAVSTLVNSENLPRGKTVFGNPRKYMDWIAADNNMLTWLTSKGLVMASPSEDVVSDDAIRVYTPTTGIIGTPQQTQEGAFIRMLLDNRVQVQKPLMQIKVDNTLIRQQKKQIGAPIMLLDQDGIYVVAAVRHLGDTRGQDWYTEITGVSRQLWKQVGAAIVQGGYQ